MKIDEIIALAKAVAENGLTSLELEEEGVKLSLKRKQEAPQFVTALQAAPASLQGESLQQSVPVLAPAAAQQTATAPAPAADIASDNVIVSPLVGTFYASSAPDAAPFVKEGDRVKKGQVLGIIEAMKLMNEIESEYDGVVEAILVGNEEVVEYGQPLFRIK